MPRILLVAEANVSAEQRRVFEAMIAGQRISAPVGPPAIAMHPPPSPNQCPRSALSSASTLASNRGCARSLFC